MSALLSRVLRAAKPLAWGVLPASPSVPGVAVEVFRQRFVDAVDGAAAVEVHDDDAVFGTDPAGDFLAAAGVVVDVEENRGFAEGGELDTVAVEVEDQGVSGEALVDPGGEDVGGYGQNVRVPDDGVGEVRIGAESLGQLGAEDFRGEIKGAGAQAVGEGVVAIGNVAAGGVDVAEAGNAPDAVVEEGGGVGVGGLGWVGAGGLGGRGGRRWGKQK
ncbi:MAG: hypothetical protein IPM73_12940 [Betaproteobacteria bacterium]|nr:hypothetical protein [Betaproteobacteria bacterium]